MKNEIKSLLSNGTSQQQQNLIFCQKFCKNNILSERNVGQNIIQSDFILPLIINSITSN